MCHYVVRSGSNDGAGRPDADDRDLAPGGIGGRGRNRALSLGVALPAFARSGTAAGWVSFGYSPGGASPVDPLRRADGFAVLRVAVSTPSTRSHNEFSIFVFAFYSYGRFRLLFFIRGGRS